MSIRHLSAVLVLCVIASACSSPTSPTQSTLAFTISPNPVPTAGVTLGCAGTVVPLKSWFYTLTIQNTSNVPFVVASFSASVTPPGTSTPIVTPYDASLFAAAFGSTTIPAQGALQGPLCVGGAYDSATLTWTFVGASGAGSFTTPVIRFLP
jgi:hypothetical protein